jgi:hypothetical protein
MLLVTYRDRPGAAQAKDSTDTWVSQMVLGKCQLERTNNNRFDREFTVTTPWSRTLRSALAGMDWSVFPLGDGTEMSGDFGVQVLVLSSGLMQAGCGVLVTLFNDQ